MPNPWNETVLSVLPEAADAGEVLPTADGCPTLRVEREGRKIFLHSSMRPLREAERAASAVNISNDAVVVAGFGLGYETEAMLRRMDSEPSGKLPAVLIAFEHDPAILRTALDARPELRKTLDDPRLRLFLDADAAMAFVETLPTRRVSYLFHRASCELYPVEYASFRDRLITHVQKKNINIATLSRFEKLWAVNLASNLKHFLTDPGVKNLDGKFKGVPAVLVGGGPSLDRHLDFLLKHRRKLFIVACDAVLPRLLKAGLDPDIVFSVDPQNLASYFFYLCRKIPTSAALVYEPSCHRLVPSSWKGPRMTFDTIFPLVQWISNLTGGRGLLDMGGSVSTSAFDLILTTGADPIILVGQDMAFDAERTHASGSLVEYVLQKRAYRTDPFETQSYRLSHNRITTVLKSNAGHKVLSDKRLILFYWWFRDKMKTVKSGQTVLTLAENGAAVDGIAWKKEEELESLLAGKPDWTFPRETLTRIPTEPGTLRQIAKEASETSQNLTAVCRLAEEALGLAEGLYDSIKAGRPASPTVLGRLDELDRGIRRRQDANQLIAMTMQKAIFSITEGHDDFLTDDEKKDDKLATARKSVALYEALLKSGRLNKGLLDRFAEGLTSPDSRTGLTG
jgi:hypothetical protein